ncbi:hypothetical protein ACTI_33650 [Actinoplanes sp. OR16]|uniref:type VII secretion target n=1 Tax=Actinoplanes sp. OR16 TaxID=946334 RepID=UPI000F6CAB35|nr:type VII secretion target [Actinoplanes sp. OR16]BBH66680.1 hypothetical protein ACTI_33650 [Actinoplanes sp. OR16]
MRATPDELRRHAAHLDGVADELSRARSAGHDTGMTADAYGHLCVIVPILLEKVRSPLVDAIDAAARSIDQSADSVRGAADTFHRTDESAAAQLRDAGRLP